MAPGGRALSGTRKIAAILWLRISSATAGSRERTRIARCRGSGALRSDLVDPAIDAHHGRIVKRTGDGTLIEFRSVVDAVRCAIEVQNGMVERNAGLPPERRIEFRVGIHLGDVVEESDGDLMGDGVNIAARLEGIAKPGAICLSEDAYRQVRGGSIWRSPTSARPNSRTSNGRSGSIRCRSACRLKRNRRLRRSRPRNRRDRGRGLHGPPPNFSGRGGSASPHASRGRLAFLAAPARRRRQSVARGAAVCKPRRRRGAGRLSDGLTEDIITDLSRYREMDIIARNSTEAYKGKAVDVRQVGQGLERPLRARGFGAAPRRSDSRHGAADRCGERRPSVVGALGQAIEGLLRGAERHSRSAGEPSRRRRRDRKGRTRIPLGVRARKTSRPMNFTLPLRANRRARLRKAPRMPLNCLRGPSRPTPGSRARGSNCPSFGKD